MKNFVLAKLKDLPRCNFLISGGEPLIHEGFSVFSKTAYEHGHAISLQTNTAIPLRKIDAILEKKEIVTSGFMDISHHIYGKVSFSYMKERVLRWRDAGVRVSVHYIAIPNDLEKIEQYCEEWRKIGVGVYLIGYNGHSEGREFPRDYTVDEMRRIVSLSPFHATAIQILNGIHPSGLTCRGGHSALTWNIANKYEIKQCCSGVKIANRDIVDILSGERQGQCSFSHCSAFTYFSLGHNNTMNEIETWKQVFAGEERPLAVEDVQTTLGQWGFRDRIVNQRLLKAFVEGEESGRKQAANTRIPTIYCFGDSHAGLFAKNQWADTPTSFLGFEVNWLGPALAYTLNKDDSKTHARSKIIARLESVPKGSWLLLCFGEIDCRAHVVRQSLGQKRSIASVVAEISRIYLSFVEELTHAGYRVLVWNVPPNSFLQQVENKDFPIVGSVDERNLATRILNSVLESGCEQAGARFVSIYEHIERYIQERDQRIFRDSVHLKEIFLHPAICALFEILEREDPEFAGQWIHAMEDSFHGKNVVELSSEEFSSYLSIEHFDKFERAKEVRAGEKAGNGAVFLGAGMPRFFDAYTRMYQLRPQSDYFHVFFYEDAFALNVARLKHLDTLGLGLEGKTVLEVGSGVGLLTAYFEALHCDILSTEARLRNVRENMRIHRHRTGRVLQRDLNVAGSHDSLGSFDIVFCYGTLYHLPEPNVAIQDLSRSTREMLLLETCVFEEDNGKINIVGENLKSPNQAVARAGCRPGRDWVFAELKKYFPYVYAPAIQPEHPGFPLKWPARKSPYNTRTVFIASRREIHSPCLLPELPSEHIKMPG